MSVRSELEEVVKWISELSAKAPEPPQPPTPETWERVGRLLDAASERLAAARRALTTDPRSALAQSAERLERQARELELHSAARLLAEARAALPTEHPSSALADSARELEHEASDLALRARLHAERPAAKPKPKRKRDKREVGAQVEEPTVAPRVVTEFSSPTELLRLAAADVGRAYMKLEASGHPISKAFAAELDVLAEMTLSLAHRCEHMNGRRG